MKEIRLEPEAESEIGAALAFLEGKRPGYAARLRSEIDRGLDLIAAFPQMCALEEETEYRLFILSRFEYSIVYEDTPQFIRVVAFAHHKRRPFYWATNKA